jgi:small subunit ribosomal protein S23
MWLMTNAGLSQDEAYDMARKEFYALRQEEEIERRVAREEARHVGAYFNKTRLEISMEIEGQEYERWKKWAGEKVEAQANRTAEITFDDPDADAAPEAEGQEVAQQIPVA